jgi:hypothetical protein
MSVAQLEAELTSLNGAELDALEVALRREKSRRQRGTLSVEETRMLTIINEALPGGSELHSLRLRRDEQSLSETDQVRLVALEDEREIAWARKLRAVSDLADLRGTNFDKLYHELGLALRTEA